jgi:activator of 2-hydroxyglutaryl-CoA dehydratase
MYRLGIDVGSVSVAVALVDERNRVPGKGYHLHHGDMQSSFCGLMEDILRLTGDTALCHVAVCGVNRDSVKAHSVNEITALIAGTRFVTPDAHSVMEIGGQSSKYVTGLRDGNIRCYDKDVRLSGML